MRLVSGEKVPDFIIEDIKGNKITSQDLIGKRYMVSFYRYASCPFCNIRISFLAGLYEELDISEFKMLAFFQSTKEDILKHVDKQETPFPIISDYKLKEYKKFGVETSILGFIKGSLHIKKLFKAMKKGFKISNSMGPKTTIPADFLVDESGIIIHAFYGKDISDHLDIEIVEEFAKGTSDFN